jgi:chorismate-pyruvate lyase
VPAGVPFGFTVVPPPLLLDPQPATRKISKRLRLAIETKTRTRRLEISKKVKIKIAVTTGVPDQKSMWKCLFAISGGTLAVREIVVITREAVELAETVKAPQDAPFGNPEQVRT